MAVPKKKKSKSKVRMARASNWKIRNVGRSVCPRCSAVKLPHTVCNSCGWYKGRQAVDVA